MRINFSNQALPYLLAWVSMALVALLLVGQPMMVHGQTEPPPPTRVPPEEFCRQLPTNAANFQVNHAARVQGVEQERAARLQERAERWAEHDADRRERVSISRGRLAERVAALSEQAATDAQNRAIQSFAATVEAAIVTRADAIEAAVRAFRASAVEASDSRMAQANEATERFRVAGSAAFAEAQAACDGGAPPMTRGPMLRENMEAAREEFHAALDALPDVRVMVEESLRPALESAIGQAVAEFKATVEAAAKELKEAFGPG